MELAGQTIEDEEIRTLMKMQKKGLGTDATRAPILNNANNLSDIGIYPAKKSNRVFRTKHFALMRKFRARGRPSLNDRHRLFQA